MKAVEFYLLGSTSFNLYKLISTVNETFDLKIISCVPHK